MSRGYECGDVVPLLFAELPTRGLDVLFGLLWGAGADDHRRHLLVREQPGDGQLRDAPAALFRPLAQALDLAQAVISKQRPHPRVVARTRVGWRLFTCPVLASEDPRRQRRVRGDAHAQGAPGGPQMRIRQTIEHIPARLNGYPWGEARGFCDAEGVRQ